MKKTVAQVLKEYRNRLKNPQYEHIGVVDCCRRFKRFSSPSNIKEHFENDGWLEFDTVCDCTNQAPNSTITTRHVRMYAAGIVEYSEIISDVKKNE